MTDRELEIEIAKRLGWTARLSECEQFMDIYTPEGLRVLEDECFKDEEESWWRYTPNYLTDRNAAAEIVAWFAKHSLQGIKEFEQMVQCEQIPEVASVLANNYPVFCGLLATPRQIAEAACKVWGLEAGEWLRD